MFLLVMKALDKLLIKPYGLFVLLILLNFKVIVIGRKEYLSGLIIVRDEWFFLEYFWVVLRINLLFGDFGLDQAQR